MFDVILGGGVTNEGRLTQLSIHMAKNPRLIWALEANYICITDALKYLWRRIIIRDEGFF